MKTKTVPWIKLQAIAADDWLKWKNVAEYFKAMGPSMFMYLHAKQAADALERLAKMNTSREIK